MFCVTEEPVVKEDIIATKNTHLFGRMGYSCIEDTIKNYFKKCQNYNLERF